MIVARHLDSDFYATTRSVNIFSLLTAHRQECASQYCTLKCKSLFALNESSSAFLLEGECVGVSPRARFLHSAFPSRRKVHSSVDSESGSSLLRSCIRLVINKVC